MSVIVVGAVYSRLKVRQVNMQADLLALPVILLVLVLRYKYTCVSTPVFVLLVLVLCWSLTWASSLPGQNVCHIVFETVPPGLSQLYSVWFALVVFVAIQTTHNCTADTFVFCLTISQQHRMLKHWDVSSAEGIELWNTLNKYNCNDIMP